MKIGTGVFYLNDKAFKFNEGDTLNIGTVKTGDVFKIEVSPKPFNPEPGFEDQVNTDLDELSDITEDTIYTISGNVYTWSTTLKLIEGLSELKASYFIGALAINDNIIKFINLKLSI